MPNYRRAFVAAGCWFFTANLLDRRSTLLTDEIEALREVARRTRERYPFQIGAFVVLPDHIHAIWTLPEGDADFSMRWAIDQGSILKIHSKDRAAEHGSSRARRARRLATSLLGTSDPRR